MERRIYYNNPNNFDREAEQRITENKLKMAKDNDLAPVIDNLASDVY